MWAEFSVRWQCPVLRHGVFVLVPDAWVQWSLVSVMKRLGNRGWNQPRLRMGMTVPLLLWRGQFEEPYTSRCMETIDGHVLPLCCARLARPDLMNAISDVTRWERPFGQRHMRLHGLLLYSHVRNLLYKDLRPKGRWCCIATCHCSSQEGTN